MLHIIKISGKPRANKLFLNSWLTIEDVFKEIEKNDFYETYFKNHKALINCEVCENPDFSAEYIMVLGKKYKPHIKQFLYIINSDVNTNDIQYYLHEEN